MNHLGVRSGYVCIYIYLYPYPYVSGWVRFALTEADAVLSFYAKDIDFLMFSPWDACAFPVPFFSAHFCFFLAIPSEM